MHLRSYRSHIATHPPITPTMREKPWEKAGLVFEKQISPGASDFHVSKGPRKWARGDSYTALACGP